MKQTAAANTNQQRPGGQVRVQCSLQNNSSTTQYFTKYKTTRVRPILASGIRYRPILASIGGYRYRRQY